MADTLGVFGDMFEDPDDTAEAQKEEDKGALPGYYARRPPHCAGHLDFPPQAR
jgi:hypothetical protein